MSSPAVPASEPAPVEPVAAASEGQALPENPADWVDLPEDLMVEVQDPDSKQAVKLTLKDLKAAYRHSSASDRKFTEADKALKKAQTLEQQINGALLAAKKDGGKSVIDWVAKEANRDPIDVLAEQLDKATDPRVIDKLAALLEKKLTEAEKEASKTPETKELEQLRRERDDLHKQVEAQKDAQVENQQFEMVKATLTAAGLKPSPMNAIQVLELLVEARSMEPPIELTAQEAAYLLKEQIRSNAEMLFKPAAEAKPVQAKASGANGASPDSAVAAAKREMKRESPRVTVAKQRKKIPEDSGSEPKSFLESIMEHAYRKNG